MTGVRRVGDLLVGCGFSQAIWIYTCYIHRFSMERIKDYFMMFLHHLLTIGLIGTSVRGAAVVTAATARLFSVRQTQLAALPSAGLAAAGSQPVAIVYNHCGCLDTGGGGRW